MGTRCAHSNLAHSLLGTRLYLKLANKGSHKGEENMAGYNIFYIIGVVVVVLFILGYLGLR